VPTLYTLTNDHWQVGLLPETGGGIAFARLRIGAAWVDFMRPTASSDYGNVRLCASFPLVPWSNRLREARFTFRGVAYQLAANSADGTAIHGVGRYHPWALDHADARRVSMTLDSRALGGVNFPFAFRATQTYRLDGRRFLIDLGLHNDSESPFPAGFGHHPYFQRALTGPQDTIALELPYTYQFDLTNDLASSAPVPIADRVDFRRLRPLEDVQIDACLTGRLPGRPNHFVYAQSGAEVHFDSDDMFACTILFSPAGKPYFAVEPVTNANDGFNLYERGIPGTGVFVLEPGQRRQGSMWFEAHRV
jgi:aldose 1-epimerase